MVGVKELRQSKTNNEFNNGKINRRKDEATHDRSRHKLGTKKAKGMAEIESRRNRSSKSPLKWAAATTAMGKIDHGNVGEADYSQRNARGSNSDNDFYTKVGIWVCASIRIGLLTCLQSWNKGKKSIACIVYNID